MDQLSTPEVAHKTPLQVPPQPHTQIQHFRFLRSPLLPQNHSQQIAWKPYCKCRRQTHSVNAFPRDYWMAGHLTMNLILLLMSKDYYINISQMLVKKFLALVIPKSGKYTVLVEAHDKLGHQGNSSTYCLFKCQYYWKGMNKDIRKYIANCVLCWWEKAKVQQYLLQMTEIPDRPVDKIAIDLVTECKTSTSGNNCILTIIDHLIRWPEAFPIPDKSADTIVTTFINEYLPVHMCPQYILSYNGTELKNSLMDQVLQQLGIDRIFSAPYHSQSSG